VLSCGAPARNDILQRFHRMLPEDCEIFTPYGATEALPVSSIGSRMILGETAPITDAGGGTCVGLPIPSVKVRIIKISDEPITQWKDDLVVAAGEIGEITVTGPIVTREYYCRPESTMQAKIIDGNDVWHRMGDLGRIDEQGRIWFCGRKSHRVVGENQIWFSIPCERVFNQHSHVFRTALAGVGDKGKQVPVICVELEKGVAEVNTEKLIAELIEIGSKYPHTAAIKHFIIHPGFPVDIRHNAKISREKLSEWASEKLKGRI
jgi:acyl-CoA synthetase (AMP-forming)/AMP-acid ligase II